MSGPIPPAWAKFGRKKTKYRRFMRLHTGMVLRGVATLGGGLAGLRAWELCAGRGWLQDLEGQGIGPQPLHSSIRTDDSPTALSFAGRRPKICEFRSHPPPRHASPNWHFPPKLGPKTRSNGSRSKKWCRTHLKLAPETNYKAMSWPFPGL
jgi:hypothetical protein